MFRRIISPFAMFLACILCAAPAGAETTVASSVEWLACDAEIVATGRLKDVREFKGPGDVVYEDCTLLVTELLKSTAQLGEVTFTFRRFNREHSASDWMRNHTRLLVFLSRSNDHGAEEHLNGALVPTSMRFPFSVVDLAEPGKYLINTSFDILEYGPEVITAAREGLRALNNYRLKRGGKRAEMLRVAVPLDSKAHNALYAGSACYLLVPNFMAKDAKRSN
jgi:hypothetical protein